MPEVSICWLFPSWLGQPIHPQQDCQTGAWHLVYFQKQTTREMLPPSAAP